MNNFKTATTLQFRNAVRLAMEAVGTYDFGSWTEAPNFRFSDPKRYVGFGVGYGKADEVADIAERILNLSGYTAQTRVGKERACYVRGTCVLAK